VHSKSCKHYFLERHYYS